jgi:hypothetical protein
MVIEIDLAVVKIMKQHIIILKGEEIAEEIEKYISKMRKRHRRDILSTEGIAYAREIQNASRSAKRGRR